MGEGERIENGEGMDNSTGIIAFVNEFLIRA